MLGFIFLIENVSFFNNISLASSFAFSKSIFPCCWRCVISCPFIILSYELVIKCLVINVKELTK